MCGITGTIHFERRLDADSTGLESMTAAVRHRGPDATAYYESPNQHAVFGHNRLSITGVDGKASQLTVNKKGSDHQLAVTFNGEIFNFMEVRQELESKGYAFVTASDTEVIPHAWNEWGEACVERFKGEFAFVVYDEETDSIFMARDRTGVKPLFYAQTPDGHFVFGSEPKALLKSPHVQRQINREALAEFLLEAHTFAGAIHDPGASFYEGIEQLKAGYVGVLSKEGLRLKQYWDLPLSDVEDMCEGYAERMRALLQNSIEMRVPKEVDTSVSLSGGLDSSIVAAVAERSGKAKNLMASCVRYEGSRNEDEEHAKLLADELGIPLTGPQLTPEALMQYIDKCVVAMDGPFDSIRRLAMYANYEHIHESGYKVTLIGEGADEFNLGYYHKFPGLKLDQEKCSTPDQLKLLYKKRAEYVCGFLNPAFVQNLDFDQIIERIVREYYEVCPSKDPLKKMQYFYTKRFLQFLEDANDRAAAANAVEARLPFVDHDLVAACLSIPVTENISADSEKRVLREAFENDLPKQIAHRRKSPFPANENLELHQLIQKLFLENIDIANSHVWEILNRESLIRLSDEFSIAIQEAGLQSGSANGGQDLNAWLPVTEAVKVRTYHVFTFLTMLRWFELYFANQKN